MSNHPTREEMNARLEAIESRIDGKLSGIAADVAIIRETAIGKLQLWGAVGTGVAAILGITLAVISIAGDRFEGGLGASDLTLQSKENARAIQLMIERFEEQDQKLDLVIEAVRARNEQFQEDPTEGEN